MIEIFFWSFGLVIVLIIGFQFAQQKSQKEQGDGAKSWMKLKGISQYQVSFDRGDAIGVDYEEKRIAVSVDGKHCIFPFNSLISVEISENGATVSKTNRGGQMAGAAIGAIALGGVGAVIGGLSSGKTNLEKSNKASINIITNSHEYPYLQVKVYEGPPLDKTGFTYTQLTKDMMPWYGRIKAIIESQ
jgi:hypothetical protein